MTSRVRLPVALYKEDALDRNSSYEKSLKKGSFPSLMYQGLNSFISSPRHLSRPCWEDALCYIFMSQNLET